MRRLKRSEYFDPAAILTLGKYVKSNKIARRLTRTSVPKSVNAEELHSDMH
jgi:hypothetical protein